MNSDPFSCHQHRDRRVGHQRAIDIGRGLRGEVTWHKAKRILANHELRLDRKEWYNLNRKAQQQKLTEQEELLYQVEALVNEGFHVRTMEEYLVNDAGERTGHVIKCLYFCSGERIRLARRFVSGFIM
ncbi:MAG: hypothetical protein MMC33_005771 [Icmadophila ericetorum]|nr:hypothetical protein [Icmadophila ericetorum]